MADRKKKQVDALHEACERGILENARTLLDRGAPVNSTRNGSKPLHLACLAGHLEVVQELLDRGADLKAVDNSGRTPLHCCCPSASVEVMKELLDRGAYMEAIDEKGETPLHVLSRSERLDLIIELLQRGANMEAVNNEGHLPIEIATTSKQQLTPLVLKIRGDWANAVDGEGSSILHLACSHHQLELVNALVDYGANINSTAYCNGSTPLGIAAHDRHDKMVEAILARGASANIADNYGRTPLHETCDERIVELLLNAGADMEARNGRNETVLDRALEHGCCETCRLLLSRGAAFTDVHDLVARVNRGRTYCMTEGHRKLIKFLEEEFAVSYEMK